MVEIIFQSSPLRIFWFPLLIRVFLSIVGLLILFASFHPKFSRNRFTILTLGGLMFLAGGYGVERTYQTIQSGKKEVIGRVSEKKEIKISGRGKLTDNYLTTYQIVVSPGHTVEVGEDTYHKISEGICYRMEIFPNSAYESLRAAPNSPYHLPKVTQIETSTDPHCL